MTDLAVIPVLVGPLQALMAVLPALLLALGGAVLTLFRPSTVKKLLLLLWSQKLVVVPVTAAIIAAVVYWPVLFPPSSNASARESDANPSLLWRGGIGRRGFVDGDVAEPARGQVQWRFQPGKLDSVYSTPAVVGNRVYVAASYSAGDQGGIVALDADSGEPAWIFDGEDYRSTFSSPSVWGDYLVIGEGLHLTRDSRIYCIDLAASEAAGRGVKLWDYRTDSHVESSPCIDDGKVYIGAGDDGFYCLDIRGDGDGNPKILWQAKGPEFLDCESSPVVYDGRVYFGLGKGGKAVVCLDAVTGEEIWRVKTPYPAFGSPAIADGKLVVGMGNGNYVWNAEEIAGQIQLQMAREGATDDAIKAATKDIVPAGEVWCLNPADGAILWKSTEVGRTVLGSPAIADGKVYFASRDKHLYCVSLADGQLLGTFDAHVAMVGAPAVGKDHVYVVTQAGQLYGVDRKTFRSVWSVNLNAQSFSSPTVARGHVYVGTTGGGLLCVGESGVETRSPLWAGPGGDPARSGTVDGSAVPAAAKSSWGYKAVITSPAACIATTLYAGVRDGETTGLARLDMSGEIPAGGAPEQAWLAVTANAVIESPVVADQRVLFVDGAAGDADRALHCVGAADGREQWRSPVDAAATGVLTTTGQWVFVADGPQSLSCLAPTGERAWSWSDGGVIGLPLIVGDVVFATVRTGESYSLRGADILSGRVLLSADLASTPTTGPVWVAGKLWVGDAAGVSAYDIGTGQRTVAVESGPIARRLICDDKRLVAITDAGAMQVIDAATGEVIGDPIEGVNHSVSPILAGEHVVYLDAKSIRVLDCRSGKSKRLGGIYRQDGVIGGEPIIVNSRILYTTEKRGLRCLRPKTN